VLEGKGNVGVGFKFTNPFNHWVAVISIGKKTELKLIRMNPNVYMLTKVVLSELVGWIAIKIIIIDNQVSLWINRKAILNGFRDS